MNPLNVKLELDNPCSIDLNSMPRTEESFFCNHCKMNVIDMTCWNDLQIIEYFNQNPIRVCARINRNKLERSLYVEPHQPPKRKFSSKVLTLLLSIFGYSSIDSIAQSIPDSKFEVSVIKDDNRDELIQISGLVTYKGNPLNGVKIDFLGKSYYSDSLGQYFISIKKDELRNSLIQFSYSGFPIETRNYSIAMGSTNYDIAFYTRETYYPIVAGAINPTFFLPKNWNKNYIEFSSKTLDINGMRELDTIASLMKMNPSFGMAIQGYYYKDSIQVKKKLGVIKNYFVDKNGIDTDRIILNKVIKTSVKKEEMKFYFVPPTYE